MATNIISPSPSLTREQWALLAVPRDDQRDTALFLQLKAATQLHRVVPPQAGEATCMQGSTAIRHLTWDDNFAHRFPPAPLDHPNIRKAEALLESWPAVRQQFAALIDAFDPRCIRGVDNYQDHPGSNSHQPDDTLGAIWATVHNPVLLAQAFVHEMAHNKLFAAGLYFEDGGPLLANDPSDVFDSPIRLDIPRPMTAVFHGVYAFMHVLALDLKMLAGQPKNAEILGLTRHNAVRMAKGLALVEKCAVWSENGAAFYAGFRAWARELIAEGLRRTAHLKKNTGPLVLIGPETGGKSTLAAALHKKQNSPCIITDNFCWQFWWRLPQVRSKVKEVFGQVELADALVNSGQTSEMEILAGWLRKGVLRMADFDLMKLQLVQFSLQKAGSGIIELGQGHAVLYTAEARQKLKEILSQFRANVVLVRPLLSREATLALLGERKSRRRGSNSAPSASKSTLRALDNPSFREVARYVVDTDALNVAASVCFLEQVQSGNLLRALAPWTKSSE